MVDQIKFNGMACEKHPQQLCQSFNYSQKASDPLLCLHCLQEQNISLSQVVMIQTALNTQRTSYLKNWPPFTLDDSEKAILEGSFSDILSDIDTQKVQIENMCTKMVLDFQNSLSELKKKFFIDLDNQLSCVDLIRDVYQESSKIQELKEILQSSGSSHSVNAKLKEFLASNQPSFEDSQMLLQNTIAQFQGLKKLDLTKLVELTYHLVEMIQNFDLEGESQLSKQNESQKQQKIAKEQEVTIKAQQKKLQETQTQLSRIQEQVKQQQQQLSQSKIQEPQGQQHQSQLISNKAFLLENMISDPLYPDKTSLIQQHNMKKDHPPDSNVSKFKSLLCNNLCPKKKKPEEVLKLLLIEALTKSSISNIKLRPSIFMKSISGGYSYAHLNYPLDPGSKYILRVKFKNVRPLCDSGIGLISEDLLTAGWGEFKELAFFTHNNTSTTVGKVVRGKNIWDGNYEGAFQSVGYLENTVEMQFCIREKIFNVIDFPNRQNQVSIFEHAKDTIIESNIYLIGFYVFGKGDYIKVYDFSEVKEFK